MASREIADCEAVTFSCLVRPSQAVLSRSSHARHTTLGLEAEAVGMRTALATLDLQIQVRYG